MVIPIFDQNPLRRIAVPYVNWALILVTVGAYVLLGSGFVLTEQAVQVADYGLGLVPAVFNRYADLPAQLHLVPQILTLVTYMFLHAGWMHLLGNMLFLWVFGDNIEDAMGHGRYLAFYLLCGICAGLAFALLGQQTSETPLIGASGAISGVIAAYLLLFPRAKVWVLLFWEIPLALKAEYVLGFWIVLQIWHLFSATENDSIAWLAHVGGFFAGTIFTVALKRRDVPLFGR